jgi:LacI family repressor for deo operon, udp, cdd, tsx, nupC, and nupG
MTGESENGRKRATIWDVAHAAGVSHQTVSRYLRNEGGLRPATREKIDRAVKELDYKPNLVARSRCSTVSRSKACSRSRR